MCAMRGTSLSTRTWTIHALVLVLWQFTFAKFLKQLLNYDPFTSDVIAAGGLAELGCGGGAVNE